MAINVYGKKVFENEEVVIYSYGNTFEDLTGKLQINKVTSELEKVNKSTDKFDNISYLKIGSKAIKIYEESKEFADFIDVIS